MTTTIAIPPVFADAATLATDLIDLTTMTMATIQPTDLTTTTEMTEELGLRAEVSDLTISSLLTPFGANGAVRPHSNLQNKVVGAMIDIRNQLIDIVNALSDEHMERVSEDL